MKKPRVQEPWERLVALIPVLLGGLIPLGLKNLRQDPALASGPILTTVTDMMGFLMVLSFASMMLSKLTRGRGPHRHVTRVGQSASNLFEWDSPPRWARAEGHRWPTRLEVHRSGG